MTLQPVGIGKKERCYAANMNYNIDGERVRRMREDMGLRQQELAHRLVAIGSQVSQSQLSAVERGTKGLSVQGLGYLAKTLETSADYLIRLTDDPSPRADLEETVLMVERDPLRREFAQRLFSAVERLPADLRDEYLRGIKIMYDGIALRAPKPVPPEWRQANHSP